MPPKKDLASVLFHKKKPAKQQSKPATASPQRKPRPPQTPKDTDTDNDDLNLPDGPYTDYKLFSSALNGWKYDVMKFDSRKPVDISTWRQPIKLNRKDLRRDDGEPSNGPAVGPMLGPDGKPVVGSDGKMVMVDAEGRVVTEGGASKGKGPAGPGKKKFQKKTRQVFLIPEETKQLRKEERYPWVMEDSTGQEVWTAQLDDTRKAEMQCFFMPAANDVFKFVPAHRWYKFQKKLKHALPTDTQNVESAYQQSQKRDPSMWFSKRVGRPMSESTQAMFKGEDSGNSGNSLVHSSSQSLGPGGRKLRTVDRMDGLFEDEEGNMSRRQEKEFGEEGDMDEMVFEEEFADDDEKMEVDGDDEEAKELEERLKREYKTANKTREGYIDESDEEEKPEMSKAERRMQKLIRSREGNDAYESDDEKNPYASSEESSDEEEEIPPPPPPPSQTPQPSESSSQPQSQSSQSQSQVPASSSSSQQPAGPLSSDVRATSPVSPSLGGHSVLAKRATSPKPKLKTGPTSRGASPLASRASSPAPHSRATSPVPNGSRAGSPVNGKKRKAEDGANSPTATNPTTNGGAPKQKKRKATVNATAPGGELDDRMLIEWLRARTSASTRDCIHHFTPYLTDDTKKARFTALVKEVAVLKGGVLVLRNAYRGESAAPSPQS